MLFFFGLGSIPFGPLVQPSAHCSPEELPRSREHGLSPHVRDDDGFIYSAS